MTNPGDMEELARELLAQLANVPRDNASLREKLLFRSLRAIEALSLAVDAPSFEAWWDQLPNHIPTSPKAVAQLGWDAASFTAARRAAAPVAVWQPIETAPKDGTEILTFKIGNYKRRILAIHWWDGSHFKSRSYIPNPTHWMPLPSRPDAALTHNEGVSGSK